jgi:hypothetical protein
MLDKKTVIFMVLLIVLWGLVTWLVFRSPQAAVPVTQNSSAGSVQVVANNRVNGGVPKPVGYVPPPVNNTPPAPSQTGVNVILAPLGGAQWVFGQNNTVQWKRDTDSIGYIYLVNAADGSIAGWLIQQTNAHDTSFSWNTRDLYISRTSPIKQDVAPGRYIIKVGFTSPQWGTIASAPFSIVAAAQAVAPVNAFFIKNGTFSPSSLSVKEGTKLIFTDNDAVAYHIIISGFGVPFTLEPGGSYTFDTSPLSPGGTYTFYSASSSVLRASVVIQ